MSSSYLSSTNITAAPINQVVDGASLSLYGGMTPNFKFNTCMIVIWGILLTAHIIQLIYKQYWFSIAFICTGILEVLGYIGRTWSHHNTTLMTPFLLNMICLTIAPVFTMGGLYYQMAKLIEIYGHKYSIIKSPMLYSYIFITSDIVSLAIQAAGGGTAGMAVANKTSTHKGDNIFVAGLAVQVASMATFLILWFSFLHSTFVGTRLTYLNQNPRKFYSKEIWSVNQHDIDYMYVKKYHYLRLEPDRWQFRYFTLAMSFAVLTIFTRCVYRLCELAEGWSGYLITHEWYFIILDSLMVSLATVTMTIFHPGYAFLGRTTSVPIGTENERSNRKRSFKWLTFKKNKKNPKNTGITDDYDLEIGDFESSSSNDEDNFIKDEKRHGVPKVEDELNKDPKNTDRKFW